MIAGPVGDKEDLPVDVREVLYYLAVFDRSGRLLRMSAGADLMALQPPLHTVLAQGRAVYAPSSLAFAYRDKVVSVAFDAPPAREEAA